jgi:histidinol-phosphate aminotransferase
MISSYYTLILLLVLIIAIIYFISKRRNYIEKFSSEIEGKTILVTAATNGIGLELVKVLAKKPINLFITGLKQNKIIELTEELQKINKNVKGKNANFMNENETRDMWKAAIKEFGKIDVVIHIPINSYTNLKITRTDNNVFHEFHVKNMERILILNKLAIDHMKQKKIKGKIILSANGNSNHNSTKVTQGSQILVNGQIEKYADLLANEVYSYGIAVCVIRIDKDIGRSMFNYNIPIQRNKLAEKLLKPIDKVPKLFGRDPKKIVEVYLQCLKMGNSELSGKIISTENYINNKRVADYVNVDILQRNTDHSTYLRDTEKVIGDNQVFLNTQVNTTPPKKVRDFLGSDELQKSLVGVNKRNKYKGELPSMIAEKCSVPVNNIVLFKTERDLLKKLIDIFLNTKNSICLEDSPCPVFLAELKEADIERVYLDYSVNKTEKSISFELKKLDKVLLSNTKMLYLSSPGTMTGVSLGEKKFTELMLKVPSYVLVVIDQRHFESSINDKKFDCSKFVSKYKNLIVIRSFNNFYSVESLTLSYIITNSELANIIESKNILNQIDSLNERIAINALSDKKYEEKTKNKIKLMNEYVQSRLETSNMKFLKSETNYIMVDTFRSKEDIYSDLENENIVLYENLYEIKNYWTLPISMKKTENEKIISVLNYEI